ncbi:heat shock protein HspQ [Nocardia brasiliensis]|uniref:heat shock protein HspQ n=1 Tax=Nocardia brasiliensis TaxID=37326 RepID=UPI00366B89B7
MTEAKFGIGDRVRHVSLGRYGVVVGVDAEYSPAHDANDLSLNPDVRDSPWYRVTMEDEQGESVDTYLSEAQLDAEG